MNGYNTAAGKYPVAPQDARFTLDGYSAQVEVEYCRAVGAGGAPKVVDVQAVALCVAVGAGKVECVYAAVAAGDRASNDQSS